jgi:hypothetical protein
MLYTIIMQNINVIKSTTVGADWQTDFGGNGKEDSLKKKRT